MAYNHVRDKVKSFLQPFAESGQAVGAEDVKAYFAKLRGDEEAMRLAASGADQSGGSSDSSHRREQGGEMKPCTIYSTSLTIDTGY
jgi:E3 ubiquitin-protein ligase UBR7